MLIDQDDVNVLPSTLVVKLSYFKQSGKWYSNGDFTVPATLSLIDIWDMVKKIMKQGKLPGLVTGGGSEFYVLCNVPGHVHEHPALFIPELN